MNISSHDIDLNTVERAIHEGFPLLRFDAHVERRFQADVADERCRHIVRHNYIALIVYHLFLISDYRSVGDVFYLDIALHALVMTPVTLLVNFILARRPPTWLRETIEMIGAVILGTTIALVVFASQRPDRDLVLLTLALVILFVIVMQRMQFWSVLVGCIVLQLLYSFAQATIAPFSLERTIASNALFSSIVAFSLVGAYNLERAGRMTYLLRLRDLLRNNELEISSLHDVLTGLANRRALDRALRSLLVVGAGNRAKPPVAILLLDIDHFKQFNDTNGHQRGDLCLRRVADLVSEGFRCPDDTVFRFGGEEFLVLLRETGLTEALHVADSIRKRVEQARIPRNSKANTFVTISIGVATEALGPGTDLDAVIAAADKALYEAKGMGRNIVWPCIDDIAGGEPARRLAG